MAEAIRSFVWHWFGAIVIGMIFIAGTFWILPLLPWWVYVILFLIAAGLAAKDWRGTASHEMIVDADNQPNQD